MSEPYPIQSRRDRAPLAETLGSGWAVSLEYRPEAPEALCPDHAALPFRRSAHRALVCHDPFGCPGALHAHARLQCAVPDGLRCLWPAGGECRHQAQHPPQGVDLRQHRPHAPAAEEHGRDVRLAAGSGLGRPGILPLDTVVTSASSTSTAWPTARCRRWIGARTATPPWRASRCGATTATASAATRR